MQSITVADAGSYTLTWGGETTVCLAHDAEDWELEVRTSLSVLYRLSEVM